MMLAGVVLGFEGLHFEWLGPCLQICRLLKSCICFFKFGLSSRNNLLYRGQIFKVWCQEYAPGSHKGIPYWARPHPCSVWEMTCWFSSSICDFPHHFECLNQFLPPIMLNRLTSKYFISQSTLWINFSVFYAPDDPNEFGWLGALKNQWLYMMWLLHLSGCWMIPACASSFANHFRIPLGWEGLE